MSKRKEKQMNKSLTLDLYRKIKTSNHGHEQ